MSVSSSGQTLHQLSHQYPTTDKFGRLPPPDHHQYHETYEDLFRDFRERDVVMLEIGVAKGDSIRIWGEYFSRDSCVYGVDIKIDHDARSAEDRDCTAYIVCDAYHESMIAGSILETTFAFYEPNGFDIIIDDGPHTASSQVFAITHFRQMLKSGGVLVVEDVPSENDMAVGDALAALDGDRRFSYSIIDRRAETGRDDECLVIIRRHDG